MSTTRVCKCCEVHGLAGAVVAVCLALSPSSGSVARGQAVPTAQRKLALSSFAGVSGVYTGLGGARNIDVTAGFDVGFMPHYGFYPSAEVRGSYPVVGGVLDNQRNLLVGLKVARKYAMVHLYVDLLVGRGQIKYHGGYPAQTPGLYYLQSSSNVFSPGAGLAVDLVGPFGLIADAQIPRYSTPVTTSGHLYAKVFTLGLQYRFR